ncbi:MAG: hypothetical protein JNM52_01050 [Betaproteobacteria bacterium]|nr:hypothetical protein [Betaproteobacteria bacterium]
MKQSTKRLIVGSLSLVYISYATYFIATSIDRVFSAICMAMLLYFPFAYWYMLQATKQRQYGRVIFYMVSMATYSAATNMIMSRLSTPEGSLPPIKRFFGWWLNLISSHTPSEYLLIFLVDLVIAALAIFLMRRYWLQNKKPE